jgi:ribonucleoside-diphosphate reductase alpha chain
MMDNPEILFDPEIQRKGAEEILKTNERIAKLIGINPAARTTCVKPAGSTSCVLGTASGIHPHHARRYIRRVQANRTEFCGKHFSEINPEAVEDSVWSPGGTDIMLSFLCEVPAGAKVKNQLSAVELLEKVKLTQTNWVEYGTRPERSVDSSLRHNVSNTITVKPDEWLAVEKFIFKNQKSFAGISLLPESGDKDYPQAPFTTVHTSTELSKMYGNASHYASGLIVDGLHAFDNNLWAACDVALGLGEQLPDVMKVPVAPVMPERNGYTLKQYNQKLIENAKAVQAYYVATDVYDTWYAKKDWVRRANKFAEKHFDGDLRKALYCLKDVSNLHLWDHLQENYQEIDWSNLEEDEYYEETGTMEGACIGGACTLK